jgi:hypothetical protein
MKSRSIEVNIAKFIRSFEIDKETGCHNYTGCIGTTGYGKINILRVTVAAHRLSYSIYKGPIPDHLLVCHKCDNPKCINPDHLFLGSYLENNLDKIKKGRDHNKSKTHCKNGHEFSIENTNFQKNGKRKCRVCDREKRRKQGDGSRPYRYKDFDINDIKNQPELAEHIINYVDSKL